MILNDILTPKELEMVFNIHEITPDHQFAQRVCDEVIAPVIDRISQTIGQEMDAKYVSYMIQHTLNK